MSESIETLRTELEERLRFETLLTEISARFINLPANRIGAAIERAQRRICELLDLDRSPLFQLPEEEPGVMVVTCLYQSKGSPSVAKGANVTDPFPWAVRKLLSGETVTVGKMSDLPSEAARDRESWRLYGTKSTVVVPLSVGGGPVFGALTFAAFVFADHHGQLAGELQPAVDRAIGSSRGENLRDWKGSV